MSTKAPLAVFRCDASPTIGAGHVSRCLAIAEALADVGWRIAFAVGPDTTATMPVIASGHFAVHELAGDARDEVSALHKLCPGGADLLVLDHYDLDVAFERECRSLARRILVMDDSTGRQHDCDFLVDAAASDPGAYEGRVPIHARLLLGPAYAVIRRTFVGRRASSLRRRDGRVPTNILVSFGATDPQNATAATLAALDRFSDHLAITVAMSSRAPHIDDVQSRIRGGSRLILDADMAELMTQSDLAVGAAGASAFERAALGLPSILLTLADNQLGISRFLTQVGAAIDCGRLDEKFSARLAELVTSLATDGPKRIRMAERASQLVDGQGAGRIVETLCDDTSKLVATTASH
jgi:UDP-2,4-diacetamido-2,4,6-trideoxy-beta-L-altropyranose hydrolase